ncbi:MAG: iron-containing alcohol dehydrogenase [Oscillospiraceae bacterium]|nr:iron-containing alcohol dehydrogenase [Oscillospiraceae bacterium]
MFSAFASTNPLMFGTGTSKLAGEKCVQLGIKKALVVFDKGVKAAGIADKILGYLSDAGVEYVCYDGVLPDPPDWSCEEAGALGVKENVDGIVAVGGGSSIDTGKAAKALLSNPPPLSQYFGRGNLLSKPGKPLIVIPTTAGTGSEATPGGAITDSKNNIKTNVNGVGAAVSLALVDPELTMGLPPAVTASTGFDALCHAAESFTSQFANPYCEATGKEAIRLVGKYLARAVKNGANDPEAREGMMRASTLGGVSMLGPMCHFPHDVGKVLGAKWHIPHGNACSMVFPQTMELIAPACPEKVKFIAEALGGTVPENATVEQIGKAAYDASLKLMREIELPTLKDYKLTLDELLPLVGEEVVKATGLAAKVFGGYFAPMPVTVETVNMLVTRAFNEN